MAHVRVCFVSAPRDISKELAHKLCEERLAACVNIIPRIDSVYWWEDKLETDEESLLIIKTTQAKVEQLIGYVRDNHPYPVPEVIMLEVSEGLPDYLNWVAAETVKK